MTTAFAGGFIPQSLMAYWFHLRYGVEPGVLGVIFFGANLGASEIAVVGNEELVTADIRDLEAVTEAMDGVDATVHLAGIPHEDSFDRILETNVVGTYNVYEAARNGSVDVVVGTRTAALLGLARPGSICVVDEPNAAHRAEQRREGLPLHVRDVALERARLDRAAVGAPR